MSTLMKCGHVSGAVSGDKPVCAICVLLDPRATQVEDAPPDLAGRLATCCYCGKQEPSSVNLAFFEYCPTQSHDRYYSGCRGWD